MLMNNPLVLILAGLIPMLVGAIWYGPLFGRSWMRVNGFSEDTLKTGNMAVIFGLSFLLSIVFAVGLAGLCIHQNAVMQLFAMHPDFATPGTEVHTLYTTMIENYGDRHRTFGHGAVHGGFATILLALPLIAINALFERRGWKYIGIHTGYWLVTMVLMCGVICQWL